jgi:hypothetical protein
MATDLEKLVVALSADVKSYENAIARATGVTRQQLKQIKTEAGNVGTAAEQGFRRVSQAAAASNSNVIAFRGRMSQLGFQAQDLAVQVADGTSALRAFAQQAPQALGAFGPAGVAIGAVVAALPLLITALGGAGDESVSLEDRMTALTDALGKVKQAAELQGMSIDELTARYGDAGEAVQKLIDGIAQLAVDEAARSVRDLQKSFGEFTDPTFFQIAADGIHEITTGAANLVDQFDLTLVHSDVIES